MALLVGGLLCSCSKNLENLHQQESSDAHIKVRTISNTEIDWLIDFQSYLYDLEQLVLRTNTYSLDSAVYGVEALINIKYAEAGNGIVRYSLNDTFDIQTSSDWFDLFENAHDNIVANITSRPDSNAEVAAFDISIDTVIGTSAKIITKTIFKIESSGVTSAYGGIPIDCEAEIFDDNEQYYLWLGGTDVLPLYQSSEIDCSVTCGTAPEGTTAAMEEIQHHINASYPNPDCGPGRVWTNKFISINYTYSYIEWAYNLFEDCGVPENQSYYACDCLNADILNCMLCTIYDEIDTYASPIRIPQYNHFISINLGIDFIYIPPLEESPTRIDIQYFYGIPVCANDIVVYTEEILTMDLEKLLCC